VEAKAVHQSKKIYFPGGAVEINVMRPAIAKRCTPRTVARKSSIEGGLCVCVGGVTFVQEGLGIQF